MSCDEMTEMKYNRSASEGNLADCEDDESYENNKIQPKINLSETFSTLPRRISTRKKFKRKQLKEERLEKQKTLKKIPKSASTDGFFTRLFRTLSVFTGGHRQTPEYLYERSARVILPTPVVQQAPIKAPKPKTRLISASNTDIRTQVVPIENITNNVSNGNETADITREKSPALCGLRNHGNTCFMNAVLQCLNNTDAFAEYFILDQYKVDLNRSNKILAKKYGTKGQVTEQLAVLLKSLWSYQYGPEISNKFKALVAKHGNQYEGSLQHDAQEFLLWLLDKVHEDLNIATKKKYKKPKSSHGRLDADVAAEMLSNYRRCNNSFVQDLFQAQFRSSLSCPGCGKHSNTFDPYLCISLPIPHHQTRPITVKLVRNQNSATSSNQVLHFAMDTEATVKELREKVSVDHQIPEEQLILIEVTKDGFQQSLTILDSLSLIKQEIYIVELPVLKSTNESGEHVTLLWINQLREETHIEIFGPVFVMSILREATYGDIQKQMLEHMKRLLKNSIPKEDLGIVFKLRLTNGFGPSRSYIPHDVEHPLYTTCVEEALIPFAENLCGPPHLKLVAEWDSDTKMTFMQSSPKETRLTGEDPVNEMGSNSLKASLYQCFELYFMEEKLSVDDAWMCPNCNKRQQGTKKLSLWSTPDIFIVHLKRFRQSSTHRTKLATDISFPLTGLNVSPYVSSRSFTSVNQDANQLVANSTFSTVNGWSPWRRHRGTHHYERNDDTYNLYAVCNHHGSMQGGHYTAYCKNPVDRKWYIYDDLKVRCIPETEVVTPDAYILFYHRSSMMQNGGSCASSWTSGYSTASAASLMNLEHWSIRMPPFHHWGAKGSQSQDNLCDLDGSKTPRLGNRNFDRTQRAYSSLVPSYASTKKGPNMAAELERHSDDESVAVPDVAASKYKTLPARANTANLSNLLSPTSTTTVPPTLQDIPPPPTPLPPPPPPPPPTTTSTIITLKAPSSPRANLPCRSHSSSRSTSPASKKKAPSTTPPPSPVLDTKENGSVLTVQSFWTITSV